ncbi:MYND-type domain-containing protein [Favolaschia claudopus]|uniref:MYND-type domain-containing protein n=1 Tax=Favolaschia claudopus TaxID=2862362 RepID=A0AAW0BMZ8_9AGAR
MDPRPTSIDVTRSQTALFSCINCSRRSEKCLSKCAKCLRVAYCDRACQKEDWSRHKAVCSRLQKVNAYDRSKGHTPTTVTRRLDAYVAEEETRCGIFIGGSTNVYGGFPSLVTTGIKCQVCFRTPFHDDKHNFSPCTKCRLAWWCSPECEAVFSTKAHTEKHCAHLCMTDAVEEVDAAATKKFRVSHSLFLATKQGRSSYIAPSTLSGWADYRTQIFPDFPVRVQSFASQFQTAHPDATHAVELLVTNATSMVMTVLAAMEKTLPDLGTRSQLCVHIVAAASRELNSLEMMEELLHYLPKLKDVVVVYVGPTLPSSHASQNLACSECKQKGRSRKMIMSRNTYHGFAKSATYRANPADLVVGFNTGMGEVEVEGWTQSLQVVLQKKVPAVFTTYTIFEAMHDSNLLIGLHAEFVQAIEQNRWRGVIPLVTERMEKYDLEHFSNNYWFIVRGVRVH